MTTLTIIMTEMTRGWISYQNDMDMDICTGQDLDIKTTTMIFSMYVIKQ